jgi:hypothetical protein
MDLTRCPDCDAPAEVVDRFVLESTDGPVEHARVRCVRRHWFLLPVRTLHRPAGLDLVTREAVGP